MVISGLADTQHVERIQLAAAAHGQRAGLHDKRRVAGDVVAIGRVADMADMQVSSEKNICAGLGEALHRDRRAGRRDAPPGTPSGTIERMMRDDHLDGAGGSGTSRAAASSICSMFSRPRPPVIKPRALFNPITAISSSMYAGSRSGLIQRRYPPNGSNSRAATLNSGTS